MCPAHFKRLLVGFIRCRLRNCSSVHLHCRARPVSSNLRLAVYSYGMRQRMDEGAFNTMWQRYQTATSGQDKTVIIRAIAQTQNISHVHRYKILQRSGGVCDVYIIIKVYSLHWQPKRLNSTVRTLWFITNPLMYISKTIYESITMKVLLIRMSSKIKTKKMSDSKSVNVL